MNFNWDGENMENIGEVGLKKTFVEAEREYSNENLIVYIKERLSKEELLKKMIHLIIENSDAVSEENNFLQNILEREKIGSTGIGCGIAIPHARFDGAKKIVVAIALLEEAINFEALDGELAKLVILVGGPKEQGKEYLNLVSSIVRAFRNKSYRDSVLSAKDSADLKRKLEEFK